MKVGTIVSADIDWLTLTFKPDSPCVGDLQEYSMAVLLKHQFRGHTLKPNAAQGYHGNSSPNFHFGGRADGYMLRVSSDAAAEEFDSLRRFFKYGRCTRIDTKVDSIRSGSDGQFANRLRSQVLESATKKGKSRVPKLGIVEGFRIGNSLTLLSRNGSSFGRIYDKSAEARGRIIPNVTRAEVEWKAQKAGEVLAGLSKSKDRRASIERLNASFFASHGINEKWQKGIERVTLPTSYTPTDDERSLDYLKKQVKPMIDRLIESGNFEEVKAILRWHEDWEDVFGEINTRFNASNGREATLRKLEIIDANIHSSDLQKFRRAQRPEPIKQHLRH